MKRNILAGLVVAMLLAACQSPAPISSYTINQTNNYGVTLQVAGGMLKAKSKPQGWNRAGKKDGYVGYGPGESGWIFFTFRNEDSGNTCAAAGNGGDAKWVITSLYLSAYPEVLSADEKGEKFGSAQPAWLKEAFPQVDLADGGVFKVADKKDGVTFLPLADANGQEGERFVYYSITVKECDGPGEITLDPGFGNGGRR